VVEGTRARVWESPDCEDLHYLHIPQPIGLILDDLSILSIV
jgi:hypothetical protein